MSGVKRKRAGQQGHETDRRRQQADSSPLRLIGGQYEIVHRWPVVVLAAMTYLLSLPMFEPRSVWLVGYVLFVPWLTAVCISRRSGWVYLISYLLGAVFFLTHLRWLYATTPPGYILGSLYLAACFPLAAWPVRHLYRKRQASVAITFPIVWTALELMRSRGPLNFPWFLVGHSQIRLLTVIQIADLVGVFGVTFVVTMVNGWLVDLLLRPILIWRGGRAKPPRVGPVGTVVMLIVVGATLIYGRARLGTARAREGPLIAVLQGDYLLSPDDLDAPAPEEQRPAHDEIDALLLAMYRTPYEADKRRTYVELMAEAARERPDVVVLPETPWALYLNRELRNTPSDANVVNPSALQHEEFVRFASHRQSYLVVGSLSREPQPQGTTYPAEHRYNSAFVYTPGAKEAGRYDKIHLVLFGEYVPFRYSKRLFWLYRFLNDGPWNPWGRDGFEYSLTPGTEFKTFPMQSRSLGGDAFSFGITICYEDVIPQVFRRFVVDEDGNKRASFMLNISNDGWFGRGTQQAQHLAACAFRAVENRVGIARAVNTGVSGFIAPDGSWYSLVGKSSTEPQVGGTGYRTARVMIDPRVTFYSRHGDLFGLGCAILAAVSVVDALSAGVRERRLRRSTGKAKAEK